VGGALCRSIPSRFAQMLPYMPSAPPSSTAGVRVLSVKLAHDARLGSDHADLAKLGTGNSASAVAVDVRLISELPDVGGVAAIHFERAKFYDQSIDVLPHILIA
jgi:hypothetical protein